MVAEVDVLRPRVGVVVVELRGEHDLATRSEIDDLFTSLVEANDLVVVDVTEARFVDSTFLLNLRMGLRRGGRTTPPLAAPAVAVARAEERLADLVTNCPAITAARERKLHLTMMPRRVVAR